MSTAIDADRNAQSGYIAEDEQTKPEMLTQPITLRISSASRSKARSIEVMGVLKLRATPDGRVRAGKAAQPAAGSGRRERAVRGDADRRERGHLRSQVSAAGEPGVGGCGAGDVFLYS
ncbi:hypothetical protein [Bradyrhizobium japonicum]|uniref:hypothetical protein n=1 Tax=Bradyrhizobium japonicum TaxID=375 RepID=UPI00200F63BE|nr:hypothetical protein [Bradyrhizobium japonicum]